MKSIIWLASYPKSGNTWLRSFLANYIFNQDTPVPINQIHGLGSSDSDASYFKKITKGRGDPNDPIQGAQTRRAVLKGIVANKADINFVKTHCQDNNSFGLKTIPTELTRSAIYILRDPLDMVISFASHHGLSIDKAIEVIANKRNTLRGDGVSTYQHIGTWSDHVASWENKKPFPVLILRYEDMLDDPETAFSSVVSHIGLPESTELLEKSIRFSSFKTLQTQEAITGFSENPDKQKSFFRKGQSGQWKEHLTDAQIARIVDSHGVTMEKYNYGA